MEVLLISVTSISSMYANFIYDYAFANVHKILVVHGRKEQSKVMRKTKKLTFPQIPDYPSKLINLKTFFISPGTISFLKDYFHF